MGRTPPGRTRTRVLDFVRERLLGGDPPTVREVQRAFGFRSPQTAREHLETLVREGRLAKEAGKARGYRLPGPEAPPPARVPLLGRVPAGPTDLAVEDLEGYLPVDGRPDARDLFALRSRGRARSPARSSRATCPCSRAILRASCSPCACGATA